MHVTPQPTYTTIRYVDDNAPRNPTTLMPFSSSRDLGRVDTSHENLPVGLVGSASSGMPRRRIDGITEAEAEAEAEFEAEAEAEKAALSRADGAPGGAATTLHAAKMSAARMNAARLLNGQSNVAGLRNGALHANDVALPTDDHMLGF
mgnify:CR=1 FL=1